MAYRSIFWPLMLARHYSQYSSDWKVKLYYLFILGEKTSTPFLQHSCLIFKVRQFFFPQSFFTPFLFSQNLLLCGHRILSAAEKRNGAECPEGVAVLDRQGRLRMSLSKATGSISLIDLNKITTDIYVHACLHVACLGICRCEDMY